MIIQYSKKFILGALLAICQVTMGQNIAVQANINLTPPYTLSLHDYTQPESNKLMVTILLKDLNIITHQVRLRFTIEGSGFTLITKDSYMPPPITLQGGVPEILGSTELESYFQPDNLNFNGLSKSDYLRTRKLPEGFYRFYVEVLDYNRGSLVSNKGVAVAFIVLNDPPIINLPLNNSKLPANDPQNILFNWAPMHLGSPNSAFTSAYEFRLYEIQPKGRNPYEIVRATNPIYETVPPLTATTLNYNIAMPSLIPGNEYAFTVRAIDRDGRDLFKNDGYSEVFKFTWGDECKPPEGVEGDSLAGGGIELKWKSAPAHTGYNISYKPSGNDSWSIQSSFIDNASIYELPGNTQIEYRLQSMCGGYQSEYSKIYTIQTMPDEKRNFSCGGASNLPAITNTTRKKTLNIGDYITIGGYKGKITKVSGSDGTFSGECNVQVPFFNLAKIPHKFSNIKINELNQVYEGKLISIKDSTGKFIVRDGSTPPTNPNTNTNTNPGSSLPKSVTNDTTLISSNEINTITTNSNGETTVVYKNGDSTKLVVSTGNEVVIKDNNGNEYKIKDGDVKKTGGSSGPTGSNGTQVGSNTNKGTGTGISGTANSNTSVGKDHAAGDEIQLGPFKVKFGAKPVKSTTTSNICTYKTDGALLELLFADLKVGQYKTNLANTTITYSVDCNSGDLQTATIDWVNNDGEIINGIGAINGKIKKASLTLDNQGKVSGYLTFDAFLTEDKTLDQFVYIKKGVTGSFKFMFNADQNSVAGNFTMEGIKDINIDLRKDESVIATLSNGKIDQDWNITGDCKLEQPVTYKMDNTKFELKKLDANITLSLLKDNFTFNTIDGLGNIKDLPGTDADLKVTLKKNSKKIVATATSKDNELFKFYGLSLGLEKLNIEFNEKLNVTKIEGTDIDATYQGTNDAGKVDGNLNIANFSIVGGAISNLEATGSLNYPPYANIKLTNGTYDSGKSLFKFNADVDLSNSTTKATVTVKDLAIAKDGKITLGSVKADLFARYGPVTIEFSSAPSKNSSKISSLKAKITLKIADAGVNEDLKLDATVDYKMTDQGLTYLKLFTPNISYTFPKVYGIQSKITGVSVLMETINGKTNFTGGVYFKANLTEDMWLTSDLKLRKGVNSDFIYSFGLNGAGEPTGSFDLSTVKGLYVDFMKNDKALATLSGNVSKEGILTGRLETNKEMSYESTGFTVTLNSLNLGATYNLKRPSLKITDGSGEATLSNIDGVTGILVASLEYKEGNLNASIDKGKSKMSFCGMTVSTFSLEANMDSAFNFTSIKGELVAKHPQFSSDLSVKSFLIENGVLKSFNIKGNTEFSGFKFSIDKAIYKNGELKCSAKVLLSDDFVSVEDFILKKNGDIFIGKCEANIEKSVMSIHFVSSLNKDRFSGSFDASLAKKISLSGTLDMGSELCSSCPEGAYSFGYYKLTVGAPIPIFAGVSISKLGGQFGYNYAIDFKSKSTPPGKPTLGNYVAGFTFGVQDNAGMIELAIDPAIFQWGNNTASLDLTGTIKVPKDNPIIRASANARLNLPSYDISGNIDADVKIPSTSGKIFKASVPCQFSLTSQALDINAPYINADFLGAIKFNGSFKNTQTFDSNGSIIKSTGQLNGVLSYNLEKSFSASLSKAKVTGNFKFDFNANLNTAYNLSGLETAKINGKFTSNGSLNVEVFGYSVVNPTYSIDAEATLEKMPMNWKLSSYYTFEIGVNSLGTVKLNDSFEYNFE